MSTTTSNGDDAPMSNTVSRLNLTPCHLHHPDNARDVWTTRLDEFSELRLLLRNFRWHFFFGRNFVTTTLHLEGDCSAVVVESDFTVGGRYHNRELNYNMVFGVHVDELPLFARLPPWARTEIQNIADDAGLWRQPSPSAPALPQQPEWTQESLPQRVGSANGHPPPRARAQSRRPLGGEAFVPSRQSLRTISQLIEDAMSRPSLIPASELRPSIPVSDDLRGGEATLMGPPSPPISFLRSRETDTRLQKHLGSSSTGRRNTLVPDQHMQLEMRDYDHLPQHIRIGEIGNDEGDAESRSSPLKRRIVVVAEWNWDDIEVTWLAVPSWTVNGKEIGDYSIASQMDIDVIATMVHPDPRFRNAIRSPRLPKIMTDYLQSLLAGEKACGEILDAPKELTRSEQSLKNQFQLHHALLDPRHDIQAIVHFRHHEKEDLDLRIDWRPTLSISAEITDFEDLVHDVEIVRTELGAGVPFHEFLTERGLCMRVYVLPQGKGYVAHHWSCAGGMRIGDFLDHTLWPRDRVLFVEVDIIKDLRATKGNAGIEVE